MAIIDIVYSSGESEECEITHEVPIDITKYEYVTGAQVRMKSAISEERGAWEKPIRREAAQLSYDQDNLPPNQDEPNLSRFDKGSTQETLYDMGRSEEIYYGTITLYLNRYLWKLEDCIPEKDTGVWNMFRGHRIKYFPAIRIRGAAISVGKEPKRNFLIGKREKANYAVLGYIQMDQLLGNENGDVEGILIERKEVGISANCVQTLLDIQSLTNTIQQVDEGKVVRRSTFPKAGGPTNMGTIGKTRYVRLLINAAIYTRVKRACVTLGAARKSRIGKLKIKGQERKKHMAPYAGETAEGKVELIFGIIESMTEDASKTEGVKKMQFKDWEKIGKIETTPQGGRGRILSKRGKARRGDRGDRQRIDRQSQRKEEESR